MSLFELRYMEKIKFKLENTSPVFYPLILEKYAVLGWIRNDFEYPKNPMPIKDHKL